MPHDRLDSVAIESAQSRSTSGEGQGQCVVCGAPVGEEARCGHCGVAVAPGGWRVIKQLAKGPHSRVFLAEKHGRRVALKELVFALVPEVAQLEAFEREAKLLGQLKHPSIPRLVESFKEGQGIHTRLYLAQEFVTGRSLLDDLATHRYTEVEAKQVARALLDVLGYLHGLSPRVIHRDLKPANVMIRGDGSLALVDFGSARDLVGGVTHGSTLVGTFGYMPPEQLGGTVDQTSDLYALGATLLHLLTRRPPDELLKPGMELALDAAAPNVSPPFLGWLKKLTARERAERFQSVREAVDALDALHRAAPVVTTVKPTRTPVFLAVMGAAVALLVLGAIASFSFVRTAPPPPPPPVVTQPVVVARPDVAPVSRVKLAVSSQPLGATVTRVDTGEVLGVTPLHVELPGGESLQLKLEHDGFKAMERMIRTDRDSAITVALEAERAAEPAPVTRTPPVTRAPKAKSDVVAYVPPKTLPAFALAKSFAAPLGLSLTLPAQDSAGRACEPAPSTLEVKEIRGVPGDPGAVIVSTALSSKGATGSCSSVYVELLDELGARDPSRATLVTNGKANSVATRDVKLSLPGNSRTVQLRFGPQAKPLAVVSVDLVNGTATRR